MRTLLFSLSCLFVSFSLALSSNPALESAQSLAQDGIIVNQSSSQSSGVSAVVSNSMQSDLYRLSDTLLRQEAMNIALKIRGAEMPSSYICRGYFLDLPEEWVCRVVELSADYGIVTRSNARFRPHDSLTLAESLKILMVSLQIPLTNSDISIIPGTFPNWQKRIVLTLREKNVTFVLYDNQGNIVARLSDSEAPYMSIGIPLSHKMTRGEFFQLVTALRDSENPTAHCTVYNDGCNDCSLSNDVSVCTKRACFWQGIPSCSACESGYTLENNRCVKKVPTCVQEGGFAGGGMSPYPEDPNNFLCCPGLTRAELKNGNTWADAGYTCINEGDGICNSTYESTLNSRDCKNVVFDNSICQGYFDGCNSCSNTGGTSACTLRYCFVNGPAYCTNYVAYTPVSQTTDRVFLDKIQKDIRSYVSDLSCTESSECRWKLMGASPCGGWNTAIPYSTQTIDETLLSTKATYYTDAEKKYNQTYGIFGSCITLQSPSPMSCVNNVCRP